jgi:hypothetical protein
VVLVDRLKPKLKPPGTKRLKLMLSTSAFKFNLRRYTGGGRPLAAPLGTPHRVRRGRAVQVDPIKPKLKPPGTERLKLKCDILLSTLAFKIKLRRYTAGLDASCLVDGLLAGPRAPVARLTCQPHFIYVLLRSSSPKALHMVS